MSYYSYGYDSGSFFTMAIVYILIAVAVGCAWGYGVKRVVRNKGYNENWFWWGFFFGFIALIVALTKPECGDAVSNNYSIVQRERERLNHGGWKCSCGRINAAYVGTCVCGMTKDEEIHLQKMNQKKEEYKKEVEKIEALKQLKELLDCQAITKEEYEEKKKMLI